MTGVLPEGPLDFLNGHFSRPRPGPHPRIFHRELVENRVFVGPRDSFTHVQFLVSLERSAVFEIGGVDDQGVTLPMADRVAHPLADVLGQMWTPVQANDADVVDLLGLYGHVSGTLYDL